MGIANGAIRQSGNAGWSVFATTTQNLTFGSNVAAGSTILVFVGYATSATAAIPYIGISDTQNNIYLANTSSASKASLVGGSTNFVWSELFTTVTSAAGALTLTLTTPALYNPAGLNGNIHVVIVEVTNPLPPVFTPSFRDITFADLPGFVNGVLQPSVGGTGANLFGTGGPSQFLRQNSAGAAITVVQPDFSDLAGVALPTKYKNIALVSNGFPAEYAQVNNITATANIGATTLYAVPAAGAGLYRLSYYVIVNRVATTSSTLPDLQLTWTDQDNSAVQTFGPVDLPAGTGAGQSGANTLTTMYQGSVVISAKASTNILYQTGVTTAYASSGATTMQYSVRLKVEAL